MLYRHYPWLSEITSVTHTSDIVPGPLSEDSGSVRRCAEFVSMWGSTAGAVPCGSPYRGVFLQLLHMAGDNVRHLDAVLSKSRRGPCTEEYSLHWHRQRDVCFLGEAGAAANTDRKIFMHPSTAGAYLAYLHLFSLPSWCPSGLLTIGW